MIFFNFMNYKFFHWTFLQNFLYKKFIGKINFWKWIPRTEVENYNISFSEYIIKNHEL